MKFTLPDYAMIVVAAADAAILCVLLFAISPNLEDTRRKIIQVSDRLEWHNNQDSEAPLASAK